MKKVVTFILLAFLLVFCATPAYAVPALPHAFYGSVTINDAPAPSGTQVSATVEGGTVIPTQNPVTTVGSSYGVDSPKLLVQGDGLSGAITFYVNGVKVEGVTATFKAGGGPTEKNLALVITDESITGEVVESIAAGQTDYVVDASDIADTTITVSTLPGQGTVTITLKKYASNPHPTVPLPATMIPRYIDIEVVNPDAVRWPMYVKQTYTDAEVAGLNEASLGMYYFKAAAWHRCSNTGVNTAANYIWANMTKDELSGSPVAIGGTAAPAPAPPPVGGGGGGGGGGAAVFSPATSNLTITPAEGAIAGVQMGEIVTITTEVENTGGRSGSYTVTLKINGVVEEEKTVTLAAYEKKTVTFTVIKEEAGTYKTEVNGLEGEFIVPELPAATFEVTNLSISPVKVKVGETVTISILVAETSGVSGSYDATLKINGTVVEKQEVALGPQQSQTVTFTIVEKEAGSYKVEVNGLVSEFIVEEPAPEAPPPPPTPTPPAKPINWWLIGGIIAAVVVVGSVTFILVRRRAY